MSFGTFRDIQEVARAYQITLRVEKFVQPIPYAVDEALKSMSGN